VLKRVPKRGLRIRYSACVGSYVIEAEVYILCLSEGREAKDRAIREKQERRLLADFETLKIRIEKGHLKSTAKIHEAIGRLKER
jgi:hypothetical protein